MQTGDTFGGSSPFLNIANATNQSETASKSEFGPTLSTTTAAATATTAKSNEPTIDTNSSRNYFDIEKIDFNSALFLNCQEQTSSSESSYSTDNSIYYSDNQPDVEPSASISSNTKEKMQPHATAVQNVKMAFRRKNSTENLSEDSGYGEFPSMKCRSKSIPNLNQDQLIEKDEHLDNNHRCSLNNISQRKIVSSRTNGDVQSTKINSTHAENVRSNREATTTTKTTTNSMFGGGASKNSRCRERDWNELNAFNAPTNANGVSTSKKSTSFTSLQSTQQQSTSLPDISTHFADDYGK